MSSWASFTLCTVEVARMRQNRLSLHGKHPCVSRCGIRAQVLLKPRVAKSLFFLIPCLRQGLEHVRPPAKMASRLASPPASSSRTLRERPGLEHARTARCLHQCFHCTQSNQSPKCLRNWALEILAKQWPPAAAMQHKPENLSWSSCFQISIA